MCLAVPAKVIEFLDDNFARVEVGGVSKNVSLALVEDVKIGDYVIVHVGFALSRLDEEQARQSLELFSEIIDTPLM